MSLDVAIVEILAALSISAAAGIRITLPLLVLGLLQGEDFWYNVPILSNIYPPIVLGILISCCLIELIASKNLLGQRLLQIAYLPLCPIIGAILAIALIQGVPKILIGLVGGFVALLLQLIQAGWFYRWNRFPLWLSFLQDSLCIFLVYLALKAPQLGGIVALILLGLAVNSYKELRQWYLRQYQSRRDR
ncbi:DUF4126 domain-containing protein [Chroococcidiopsis thermalis]|uniref:DUF4126 domain-containing protein n=1 Tax=Chroococcidiopsis thermalis (strain PCC 7203) TaxID=251229 RepID=K9TUL6_CHRTP|nr:DUF4126 domain-containing protein [Chroococcidiopsis thermalis]AFY86093.1 hypothetical protein Chro_0547 [Chroococcidiopsis thermalis PCC 7203]